MATSYSARGTSRGYVPPEEKQASGSAGRWIGLVVALLVICLAAAWTLGLFGRRTDARIVEIQKISEEMSKQMATGGPQNEEEAKAFVQSIGQMREKVEALLGGRPGGGGGPGGLAEADARQHGPFAAGPIYRVSQCHGSAAAATRPRQRRLGWPGRRAGTLSRV